MEPKLSQRLLEIKERGDPDIHFGLDVAQLKARNNCKNIDLLMAWARKSIEAFGIKMDTVNYEVLLEAPEYFEVTDTMERQKYFRVIFMLCLESPATHSPPVDDSPSEHTVHQ